MGIMGACRAHELHAMKIDDIQDLQSALLVTVPNSKTKIARKFTITGQFYKICKKYTDVRQTTSPIFFMHYQHGKCTKQRIGVNKFGTMGKQIAKFLNLPHQDMYTGHTFRRSSASLLVDEGGVISTLKRHQWQRGALTTS